MPTSPMISNGNEPVQLLPQLDLTKSKPSNGPSTQKKLEEMTIYELNHELLRASAASNFGRVIRILKIKPNINLNNMDSLGEIAVHKAARKGSTLILKSLLGRNADKNFLSGKGETPLDLAIDYALANNDNDAAKFLIKKKARISHGKLFLSFDEVEISKPISKSINANSCIKSKFRIAAEQKKDDANTSMKIQRVVPNTQVIDLLRSMGVSSKFVLDILTKKIDLYKTHHIYDGVRPQYHIVFKKLAFDKFKKIALKENLECVEF